jgi:hypothetical protein
MANGNGAMPQEIHETYNILRNQLIIRHVRWTIYRQLFGTDPARIALLNRFGDVAFGAIQGTMEDEAVLALCRMSDPAVTGKGKFARDNCTFNRLVDLVTADAPETKTTLEPLLGNIEGARQGCLKELRNRVLAHIDRETFANMAAGRPGPLRPNRANIEDFLRAARELMNAVQRHYGNGETHYSELNLPVGKDGDVLVTYLEEFGRRLDAEGNERTLLADIKRRARGEQDRRLYGNGNG